MCQRTSACAGRTKHKLSVTHPAATHTFSRKKYHRNRPAVHRHPWLRISCGACQHVGVSSLAKLQADPGTALCGPLMTTHTVSCLTGQIVSL